jgi:hypothetical protein
VCFNLTQAACSFAIVPMGDELMMARPKIERQRKSLHVPVAVILPYLFHSKISLLVSSVLELFILVFR